MGCGSDVYAMDTLLAGYLRIRGRSCCGDEACADIRCADRGPSRWQWPFISFPHPVEDASGDSAIFEITNGSVEVYHSRNFTVMTNDPPLPWHLENLLKYRSFGGDLPVPGDITEGDRFVRAMYFLKHMPEAEDADYMVRLMKTAVVKVASPRGAPYPCKTQACIDELDGFGDADHSFPTLWTSVIDVSRQVYHRGHENFFKVDLKKLASSGKLDKGAPTLVMNSTRYAIVEDVSDELRPNVLV